MKKYEILTIRRYSSHLILFYLKSAENFFKSVFSKISVNDGEICWKWDKSIDFNNGPSRWRVLIAEAQLKYIN